MTIVFAIKAWFEKSVTFPKLGNIFLYSSRISLSVVNDIGAFKRQQEVNGKLFTGSGRFFEKSQVLVPLFGNRYFSSIFVYSDDHPRRGFDTAAKKKQQEISTWILFALSIKFNVKCSHLYRQGNLGVGLIYISFNIDSTTILKMYMNETGKKAKCK